jgi:hypothetical protein
MVIRIHIASAFEVGGPPPNNLVDVYPSWPEEPSCLELIENGDLAERLFEEIRSLLALPGSAPPLLHPTLKAALTHDVKRLASFLLRSTGSKFRSLLTFKNVLHLRITLAAQLPSSEYEPYLKSQGYDGATARILANLAIRIGIQAVEQNKCRRNVVAAIRSLSMPWRGKAVATKTAIFLLEASRTCSAVETLFYESDKSPYKFMQALRVIAQGGAVDPDEMRKIISEISPVLKTSRGPKPSAASITHEFFLQHLGQAYTWDEARGDFRDPLTKASRSQFSDPQFSPKAAHRRVSRRGSNSTNA